jgi:Tol biopolymer transport system component
MSFMGVAGAAIELQQHTYISPGALQGCESPDWSADGNSLAYVGWTVDSFYPYELHSWIVASHGAGQFPNHPEGGWHGPLNFNPSWSPAGNQIVFETIGGMWIGTFGETYPVPLGIYGSDPAWSPDGMRIAFVGAAGSAPGICIVSTAGGKPMPQTSGPDRAPAWSRDGTAIAFASTRDGQADLWVVSALGGEPRRLTNDAAADNYPSWSPDGELLVFASDRSGNWDLWVMRVANGAMTQVTDHPAADTQPAWSPDGTQIAFVSDRSGAMNIWLASQLRTVCVAPLTWSDVKARYR